MKPVEKTDLQMNNNLEAKKDNMNNASSYFNWNGRPSVTNFYCLILNS